MHDEAEQLEHAVSEEFEKKLIEKLGGATMGLDSAKDRREMGWIPLSELEPGASAQVESAFERDRDLLEYLNSLGIRPQALLKMVAVNVDQTVTLNIAGQMVPLGHTAASKVWVSKS